MIRLFLFVFLFLQLFSLEVLANNLEIVSFVDTTGKNNRRCDLCAKIKSDNLSKTTLIRFERLSNTGYRFIPVLSIIVSDSGIVMENSHTRKINITRSYTKEKKEKLFIPLKYGYPSSKYTIFFTKCSLKNNCEFTQPLQTYMLGSISYKNDEKYYAINLVRDENHIYVSNIVSYKPKSQLQGLVAINQNVEKKHLPIPVYKSFKKEIRKIYQEEWLKIPDRFF